ARISSSSAPQEGSTFFAQSLFDRLAHERRRRVLTEALKMFEDAAVARDHKTLRDNALRVYRPYQRTRKTAIIPNNFVVNALCANKILHVLLTLLFVVRRRQA